MFTSLIGKGYIRTGVMTLLHELVETPGPPNLGMFSGQAAGDLIIAAGGTANPFGLRSYSVDGAGQLTYLNNIFTIGTYERVHGDRNFIYGALNIQGVASYTVDGAGAFTHKDTLNTGGIVAGNQTLDVWADDAEWDIGANTGIIYIACNGKGLRSHSVDEFGNLSNIHTIDNGGNYNGVWSDGEFIFAVCQTSGIRSYSKVAGVMTLIDTDYQDACHGASSYRKVWGDGNYLYVANTANNCGIMVYSVDSGGNFTYEGNETTYSGMYDVWGDGNLIYGGGPGINSYSESGGALTFLSHNVEGTTGDGKLSVYAYGDFVYAGSASGGFTVSSYSVV